MMKKREKMGKKCVLLVSILFFLLFAGCGGNYDDVFKKSSESNIGQRMETSYVAEFDDIIIPNELKIDNKASYVIQTPGFLAGLLVYNGAVTRNSLVDFFKAGMYNNAWNLITMLKSPTANTIILFQKTNKWCIINIAENNFSTHVEIAVAPTLREEPMESVADMPVVPRDDTLSEPTE